MYRSNLGAKDRSGAIAAVVTLHAALLLALMNGPGGDGEGGVASLPRLARPVVTGREFCRGLLGQWPRRPRVFLRHRSDARGVVSGCSGERRPGVGAIDSAICNLACVLVPLRP